MNDIYLSELKTLYQRGRLIPFIGAGVSMSLSWLDGEVVKKGPSWKDLVDEATRQLGFSDPDLLRVRGTDLQILEYFKDKMGSFTPLTRWFDQEMNPPDNALAQSPIHRALANLDKMQLIYTTNYDNLIERSLIVHGRSAARIVREEDIVNRLSGAGQNACEVVKFHGDLDFPEQMVISESHYERRLRLQAIMDYKLQSDLLGRALLFLGYSFRDWNVSYLFRLITDQFDELPGTVSGHRAYIVVSDPSQFEYRLYKARGIGVIGIGSKDQTGGVVDVLKYIGG